jgi:hypothetical protein
MASKPTEIAIPFPEADQLRLRILLGPCRVRIGTGAVGAWASGRYEDPTGLLPLHVTADGGQLTLSQSTSMGTPSRLTRAPLLDLEISSGRPYELSIEGGANETVADLGGLPLTRLTLRHGAGKSDIDFSAPNPQEMGSFDVAAGGVAMDLRNLANANFAQMVISGGAAQYRLDFGGQLRRDAEVRLNTGVATIELTVPATTAARIRSESVLGGLDVGDGFMTREGAFWNEAAVAGREPSLLITVTSVFGSVKVRSS